MIDPFENPDLKKGDRITFLEPGNENGKQSNPHLVGRGGYVYSIRADRGELHILHDLAIGEKQPFEKVVEGKTGFSVVTCKKEHYSGCLAMELDNYGDRPEGVNPEFSKGDRVKVIDYPQGPPHQDFAGREGIIHRICSSVFPNFVYVEFDLKGRERVQKVKMCDKLNLIKLKKSGIESFKNLPKQPKAMSEQITYQVLDISLNTIHESELNPRKHFDEHSIDELATSIQEKGVLQPILVREIMDTFPQEYEIVCGARRYRASKKAEMKTIPAIVRDLDDEEALEMMIIENLQRKDVNPMEEAAAIHNLLKHYGNYTEVALRLGKSARFVAERDTLNNLHENFQTLLYDGIINLTAAYSLAKLSIESQQLILDEYADIKDGELTLKNWVTSSTFIQASRKESVDLTTATFDLEDTGFEKAPACVSCSSNTANQQLLFPDGKPTCLNSVCYNIKTKKAFNDNLMKSIEEGMLLVYSSWGKLDNKEVLDILKEHGVSYLNRDKFEIVSKPQMPNQPPTKAEIQKEYMEDNDIEDEKNLSKEDLAEIDTWFNDTQGEYEEELEEYQADLEEFTNRASNPLIKKAFVIGGYGDEVGKTLLVRLYGSDGGSVHIPSDNPEAVQIQEQIDKIEAREERAKELDREKIYSQANQLLDYEWQIKTDPISVNETVAAIIAMCYQHYKVREQIQKLLSKEVSKENHHGDYELRWLLKFLTDNPERSFDIFHQCIRMMITGVLIDASTLDYNKSARPAIIMELVQSKDSKKLAEIKLNQEGIANQRQERVTKKLEDLRKKLEVLEKGGDS